jgi:hypothetical protein
MTEDEHERLVEVGNLFWTAFSKLCAQYITMMPKRLQPETMAYLDEQADLFGSNYEAYLDAYKKKGGIT